MGILAYRSRDYLVMYVGDANIAFICAIGVLIVSVFAEAPDAVIVADLLVIIVCSVAITGLVARALAWRPLIYLGETSYSLYLVHAFVLSVLYSAFKVPRVAAFVPSNLRDVLIIIAALLAASVLYHLVERPNRGLIRRALSEMLS